MTTLAMAVISTWVAGEIGVMVVVQGRYVDPTADDESSEPADTSPPTTAG